jgi:anti-sigma B factor antagonist
MDSSSESIAPLSVDVERGDGSTVVRLSGELDIATVEQLNDALAGVSVSAGEEFVIDLASLNFMDSTGLRWLITANRNAVDGDYALTVVTGDSPAKRVLELTRMNEHMKVVANLT